MGLPFQRFQRNNEYAYYPISDGDDDDSGSEYTVVSSSDEYGFERGRNPCRTAKTTPVQRREASTQSACVESATQTTPLRYPRSPYLVPKYTASTYSTSSISPALKAATSYQTLRSKTSRIFNSSAIRTDSAIDLHPTKLLHTRQPSAIELQPLPPTPTYRYPPGIVVIKTMDENGIDIIEETDLIHRNTPYIDLKPTIVTREMQTGMVQKTARTGLMDRALERIVDALRRGED